MSGMIQVTAVSQTVGLEQSGSRGGGSVVWELGDAIAPTSELESKGTDSIVYVRDFECANRRRVC